MILIMKKIFNVQALEAWYIENHRKLPFRENPNPYHIWISEIMAQQTQMETVVTYFERFIKKYPTIEDLANTDSDTLHKMVEGIGYYRRFQHMHEAAKLIVSAYNGAFPNNYNDVRKLPGVGDYTAGAIMSIAYNQPYAATDGNVIRVLSRFFAIEDDMRLAKSRKRIDELNKTIIKHATPNLYTQALMELGALVCHKQNPTCENCPLRDRCKAYNEQLTPYLPVISPQKKPKTIKYTTIILIFENKIALEKKESGLLKGMYLYPQFENTSIETVIETLNNTNHRILHVLPIKTYRHVFTHAIWLMDVYQVTLNTIPNDTNYIFYDEPTALPMAIAHRKINRY